MSLSYQYKKHWVVTTLLLIMVITLIFNIVIYSTGSDANSKDMQFANMVVYTCAFIFQLVYVGLHGTEAYKAEDCAIQAERCNLVKRAN